MKNIKSSLIAKTLAFFLFVVLLITTFGGTLCTIYMYTEGYFLAGGSNFYNSRSCVNTVYDYSGIAFSTFYASQSTNETQTFGPIQPLKELFSQDNSNFVFTITDETGAVLYTNYVRQEFGSITTQKYNVDKEYTLRAYIRDPITAKDNFYFDYQLFNALYPQRYAVMALSAVSAVLAFAAVIFLISAAGHRKGRDKITLRVFDRIPLDISAACALIFLAPFIVALGRASYLLDEFGNLAATAAFASIFSLLVFSLVRTFAVRYKAGKWWRNTIIFKILKQIQKVFGYFGYLLNNLPMIWKTVLIFGVYIFINGMLVLAFSGGGSGIVFLLGLMFNFGVLSCLCALAIQMQRLKKAGEKLAEGDYSTQVNTGNLLWDFKAHGENLNNIGQGMQKAVDARMKSERFKTELITNVSHDIKTPLTSIVNYVDLLKKEDITDSKLLEYISVLDRQSARLKKLTEDLVEASKATSGNIEVNPVRTDMLELLQQSVGEYAGRLAENGLETVIRSAESEAIVLADGRLLWRVFDNILSNICKYSQPGTRVYMDIERNDGKITAAIKNISKFELNITAGELMERFVRGDISRATEGSGLGLSIAKSLTELQKGSFDISIDGDLFKVIICFNSESSAPLSSENV